MEKNKSYNYSV